MIDPQTALKWYKKRHPGYETKYNDEEIYDYLKKLIHI